MTVLAPPPQTRVIGYAQVGGQRVPVSVDAAWFIYLTQSLYRRVGGAVSPTMDELDASRFEDAGIEELKASLFSVSDAAAQQSQSLMAEIEILRARVEALEQGLSL